MSQQFLLEVKSEWDLNENEEQDNQVDQPPDKWLFPVEDFRQQIKDIHDLGHDFK